MKFFFICIIRLYQLLLSPIMVSSCRYLPTCSEYMIESIKHYGVFYGIFNGIKRLCRCHPFGGHGVDMIKHKKVN